MSQEFLLGWGVGVVSSLVARACIWLSTKWEKP